MSERIDTLQQPLEPQHDPSLCPSWCASEHLTQAVGDGFHHERPAVAVKTQYVASNTGSLFVRLTQFVSEADGPGPVVVEIEDDRTNAATLTPDAAQELATALLAARTEAVPGEPASFVVPRKVEHPPWCGGDAFHCDVRPASVEHPTLIIGTHVRPTARMRALYGTPLEVGVVACGDEPEHVQVMLSLPFRADEMLAPGKSEEETDRLTSAELRMLGETTYLEPEEARMLARFLVEAADERDRLAR